MTRLSMCVCMTKLKVSQESSSPSNPCMLSPVSQSHSRPGHTTFCCARDSGIDTHEQFLSPTTPTHAAPAAFSSSFFRYFVFFSREKLMVITEQWASERERLNFYFFSLSFNCLPSSSFSFLSVTEIEANDISRKNMCEKYAAMAS